MREILFRGKRIDDEGVWVYGFYFNITQHDGKDTRHYIIPFGADIDFNTLLEEIYFERIQVEVDPETICQWTGLYDLNGKKIFENDYIHCVKEEWGNLFDRYIEMGYVEIKHGAAGLHRKGGGYYRPFKDWLEDYKLEIIGNVFDDPELMEVQGGEVDEMD